MQHLKLSVIILPAALSMSELNYTLHTLSDLILKNPVLEASYPHFTDENNYALWSKLSVVAYVVSIKLRYELSSLFGMPYTEGSQSQFSLCSGEIRKVITNWWVFTIQIVLYAVIQFHFFCNIIVAVTSFLRKSIITANRKTNPWKY